MAPGIHAHIEMHPVMVPDHLMKAAPAIDRAAESARALVDAICGLLGADLPGPTRTLLP